jgi:DNA modification methylase
MSNYFVNNGDAVTWLNAQTAGVADLVITDPPYESLEKHRAKGTTTRLKQSKASSNEWFPIFKNERFEEFFTAVYRVLKNNTHFYMLCDAETMFVAKPLAEKAGFKFWKPLVWDKCLAPDTLVWTDRGVVRLDAVEPGWRVATPEGLTNVLAKRHVCAPAVALTLSDGTRLTAAREHILVREDGTEVSAGSLAIGDRLAYAAIRDKTHIEEILCEDVIPAERVVYELPDPCCCLWCGAAFASSRAASAHQARFCKKARSKANMAKELNVPIKQVSRWMGRRSMPASWVSALGLQKTVTGRVRATFQNDNLLMFPRSIPLDYALGRFVGLYAAQGSPAHAGINFAFNLHKRDSHAFVARYARSLGMKASVHQTTENGCSVPVLFDFARWLVAFFVGGACAPEKFFRSVVYAAPAVFRQGVFDGLLDGDGHFEFAAQRDVFVSTSADLTAFVLRYAREQGWPAKMARSENTHLGSWKVTFDRSQRSEGLVVEAVDACGELPLVDIAIAAPHRFLLASGAVTHNCRIGMGYHYRARYEFILFFEKGKRKLNDLGTADILAIPRVINGYATEKPVALLEVLVRQSSQENELVLDPFMGSGSTGVAALRNKRKFWGNDIQQKAVALAKSRFLLEDC